MGTEKHFFFCLSDEDFCLLILGTDIGHDRVSTVHLRTTYRTFAIVPILFFNIKSHELRCVVKQLRMRRSRRFPFSICPERCRYASSGYIVVSCCMFFCFFVSLNVFFMPWPSPLAIVVVRR